MAVPVSDRVSRLLAHLGGPLGTTLPPVLADAVRAVPRHLFLPDRIWIRDGNGGYLAVDRTADPEAWWSAVYSDQPLVTQFTDGVPSSSASMPSLVLYQLALAGLVDRRLPRAGTGDTDKHGKGALRVLELGAGTGFNAGLLCALLGQAAVTTVDLDPDLVAQAAANLKTAGCSPTVVLGDAAQGWLPGAPYDLILATFSVDRIPDPWRAQLAPTGRIVTPWYSDWTAYGMLTLTTAADGAAEGRFHPHGSYMVMRTPNAQNATEPVPSTTATANAPFATLDMGAATDATTSGPPVPSVPPPTAAPRRTRLSPWTVTADPDTEFHLGLTVPHTSYEWDTTGQHAPIRFALYSADGSTATIDHDGIHPDEFSVTQTGPRALWTETETAYARWEQLGRPTADRHGLTVTPDGTHCVWLDRPDTVITTLR
ncbi:protein-L-isoaspartate O-methyltransferase [Streptomyces sp. NPDC058961]|uniref:protein-L-isoaspartate O-methyltransferase family protein n=1 Tax=Streptomyces sp. NPDC058961 TaxID=3346680 RepID=UPI0036BF52DA